MKISLFILKILSVTATNLIVLEFVHIATVSAAAISLNNDHYISLNVERQIVANSLTNIYIASGNSNNSSLIQGKYALYQGSCSSSSIETINDTMRQINEIYISTNTTTTSYKLSWRVPATDRLDQQQQFDAKNTDNDTGSYAKNCLYLKNEADILVAKSNPYVLQSEHQKKRRSHAEFKHMYLDAVDFDKSRKNAECTLATSKDQRIGIIGAGISGLFSAYLLDQVDFHNYEILEATSRVGGRIHTAYFDDSQTVYQEMGAMRLPVEIQYENETLPITDTKLVFQVAEELNLLNEESHQIEFIPWYQHRSNNLYFKAGFRFPDGRIPTVGETQANPNLTVDSGVASLKQEVLNATSSFTSHEWFHLMSEDLYAAHRKALDEGFDDWSEWGWLHNKLGLSLNATNYATGMAAIQLWQWMYDIFVFSSSKWRTIQGGMENFPRAFLPQIGEEKITYRAPVSRLEYDDEIQKVTVKWKAAEDEEDSVKGNKGSNSNSNLEEHYQSRTYDNVIVSAPFSVLRTWHLPKKLDYMIREAIHNLAYSHGCKVALEFDERFWEQQYKRSIQGGCDDTDLLSETTCYPVNNIGHNGPAAVLASYVEGDLALSLAAMTEQQHVERVLEDFKELHGNLVEKHYTGKYVRKCYSLEPFQSGTYAIPYTGQHKLYMPSYFKIDHGLVFVGEHTDIKHGWISAALASAIRGVVMLLVEFGHISEAKHILNRYNITSINI
ncbi:flavin-containing amine oxidoreductase-domain containing protein [Mycotypha africana]|uniref:flavin-containing amine oxidoreductase-domain containing protein n=1 Tax=Mycotypha africana TaxID=64632 RepID=UPI002301855E|nr:flavin-containing amine oxidoreductase-domain containing protein [Mycotypha africana]KAI8992162.1 flavin-containing amine oxidoreductase-domain containing protein [Mycotypha africana]